MDKALEASDQGQATSSNPPLFVDLDGTLIFSDILLEQCLGWVRKEPLRWPKAFFWLLSGKAAFKRKLQEVMPVDAKSLPYNQALIEDLKRAAKEGRTLVLATAADREAAEAVAAHLDLFEEILATEADHNLSGQQKLNAILTVTNQQPFSYAGDSHKDLPLFASAAETYLVNPSKSVEKACAKHNNVQKVYRSRERPFRALLKAMRPHQWVKNILLFVPLFTAHAWDNLRSWQLATLAFLAYCAVSSATYLINDLLDLQADRRHPEKRRRPFASGALAIQRGILFVPVLILCGWLFGFSLGPAFLAALAGYFITSQAYSFFLKSIPLLDVTALAGLFTLRVFSGAYAIDVPMSKWLLAFSMFLFFSLAFVKRYAELHNLRARGEQITPGRGYKVSDIDQLALFGTVSGFMSVLILALYISSPEVKALYSHVERLWLICPAYLIWINWIWMATKRGKMREDPILFAFKDPGSYLAGIWVLVSVFISL